MKPVKILARINAISNAYTLLDETRSNNIDYLDEDEKPNEEFIKAHTWLINKLLKLEQKYKIMLKK